MCYFRSAKTTANKCMKPICPGEIFKDAGYTVDDLDNDTDRGVPLVEVESDSDNSVQSQPLKFDTEDADRNERIEIQVETTRKVPPLCDIVKVKFNTDEESPYYSMDHQSND